MRTASISVALLVGCNQEYEVLSGPVDIDPADVVECPFSPIPGTVMSVYDCNPVFAGTDEDWVDGFISVGFRTQVVLGHPFYQIWYSSSPDTDQLGGYGLGYAISADGTHWDPHPANPLVEEDGGWDADNMDQVVVVWDAERDEYVLAYQGYNLTTDAWGIGMMTSPDGADWTPYNGGDRVLDLAAPVGDVQYCWPMGFQWELGVGYFGYLAGQPGNRNVCQMYEFSGAALEEGFDLGTEPVLRAGPEPYDASGMAGSAVVHFEDTWYMFYIGFREWEQHQGYQSSLYHSLNVATSTDGLTWTKSPDNPLPVSLTEDGVISGVAAQVVGSRIHLWITDYYEGIGQQAVGYYLFEPTIDPHP